MNKVQERATHHYWWKDGIYFRHPVNNSDVVEKWTGKWEVVSAEAPTGSVYPVEYFADAS